jgi:hypothetical protein
MGNITLSKKPLIKPIFDLYAVHDSITKEIFYQEINDKKYDDVR